jgi:hypothetical protein
MRQVLTDFVAACLQHAQQQQQQQQQQDTPQDSQVQAAAGDQQDSSSSSVAQPVCQVVSLGAGNDSSWFSLQQQGQGLVPAVHYIELDYQEVCGRVWGTNADMLLQSANILCIEPFFAAAAMTVQVLYMEWTMQQVQSVWWCWVSSWALLLPPCTQVHAAAGKVHMQHPEPGNVDLVGSSGICCAPHKVLFV